ncbi:hypothetical protein E3Q22_01099 [Wallemia mellicola]|uniref:Uncharacterized protein n=2 Tax=Wallemia mellicola TaxID=1708541 RepID=A0A4T0LI62_9BASI|nr:hypothetical protein WALSEDRAFT_64524 [Wallemia mellicola CBS 633.66]TIB69076.1 hypothetical protein E3Q24_03459 [Wallemia mellicola]EIM21259.1 hypothetical protein WALSEDRAFT_64524 [Wallemia mellicola CBS 633.66]TIB76213.1 hypothetical protein E3Q23_01943 [Wallemia mellicola]TIB81327.1 hypothetical protein E3Q22_01099 [Wallemia mellicola]TIB88776.1 hypothetical protein E3Q21_00814 [Wallemia mellicola]|eukprot:XP_006958613.1 hypothetical protein WALSEDRAFT_64524 [Wallemia mellicola CBS 633.66]
MSGSPFGIAANAEGGYAVGGKQNLPLGKATVWDKILGNLDYFLATVTRSSDQKQLAKLRKYGGKKAVIGEARSPKF